MPKPMDVKRKEAQEGAFEALEVKDARVEPYPLPETFEWSIIDITKDIELNEVYDFLKEHYVSDNSGMYRFRYTPNFLKWSLTPPDYQKDWIIGVRVKANKKLVGFISGVPLRVCVKGEVVNMAGIDFLCIHSRLRSKRLAPVLIKEVTRRVNLKGFHQAIYTIGKYVPTPIAYTRYYYRPIDYKKLLDVLLLLTLDLLCFYAS